MKNIRLKESCTQYSVTRNGHGDLQLTNLGSILCLYRNIEQLNRGVNFREEVQIQGMFWFAGTATVNEGDVIGYNNQYFRIENIVKAKTLLTQNSLNFIKCQVSIYRTVS